MSSSSMRHPPALRRDAAQSHHRSLLFSSAVVCGALGVVAALLSVWSLATARPAFADGPHIDAVTFGDNRVVDPASARFLTDAISAAKSDGAQFLLIRLDTPGGDLDSMKLITQQELNAGIPIVVYITPQNARAGSAGTFIALAAPVVAMAPNTRIGAASPIDSSGQNLDSTLTTKIENDLEAQLRSDQSAYGRSVEPALLTVSQASSFTDQEAIANGMVNFGASDDNDLLTRLDGYSVTLANKQHVTLRTAGVTVDELQPTLANQLETVFLDPTVVLLLFALAAICLYLELSHPGAIVPGVVGGVALILFLFTAGALNPNWTGLALMLLAVALLAVDVRVPTHGVLTIGALVAFVIGALLFFDSGADRGGRAVSPVVIGGVALGMGLVALIVLFYALRSRDVKRSPGGDGLLGRTATVIEPLAPRGRVRVLGEEWSARLANDPQQAVQAVGAPTTPEGAAPVAPQLVRVTGRSGLTLIVEPLTPQRP